MSAATVPKLYRTVIDDVINNVREMFLDDGVDEQILLELKQMWEKKVSESKAIDHSNKEQESATSTSGSNGQQTDNQSSNSNQRVINSNRNTNIGRDSNQQANNSSNNHQNLQTTQHAPQTQYQVQHQLHPQVTQASSASASRHIATTSPAIAQQLNFAPGSIISPNLFQFPTSEGVDGSKTVTVPQKVIFTFNPQTSGLQTVMSSPATAATLALPPQLTANLFQQASFNSGNVINVTQPQTSVVQHTNNQNNGTTIQYQATAQTNAVNQRTVQATQRSVQANRIVQFDGPNDSSEEDEEEDDFRDNDDDHEDNDEDQNDDENEYTGEEEEPLNSGDDVSDEDTSEIFETDNVVVCQYDKITRSRNKWKFHLKDGIMNLQGKDYVFQKAIGDAEW